MTEPMYDVLVVGRSRRICAHLLSLLPAALLALLLTAGRMGYLAGRSGAVGEVRPWDVLAGPACVLLAGVVGVLLSTLVTSAAVAPMAVVGLGMLTFAGAVNTSASWRWFGLLAFENENAAPLPAALVHRPAAAHLAWLAALVVLLGATAVLRAAWTRNGAQGDDRAGAGGSTRRRIHPDPRALRRGHGPGERVHRPSGRAPTVHEGERPHPLRVSRVRPVDDAVGEGRQGRPRVRARRGGRCAVHDPAADLPAGGREQRRTAPAADGVGRRRQPGRHAEGGDGRHGLE